MYRVTGREGGTGIWGEEGGGEEGREEGGGDEGGEEGGRITSKTAVLNDARHKLNN